ncbi:hypothetical protein H6784_03135 [Candidatus Nomurabacteria bacterium]|nr:hypothetical protein [Candidatus Kaiserbacteria bacterium]MCB9814388.1 hypothetical protein [Candidatus Nomurabacteria bacterium]
MRTGIIEQAILNQLYTGSWRVADLVEYISAVTNVSVQGVYKAVRKLKAEEVVFVYGKFIALSGIWIAQEKEKLLFAEQAYKSAVDFDELTKVKKSKKMVTSFNTLNEIDLFWTHSYFQCAEQVDISAPSYSIQPHDWYPYVRPETDAYWIQKHLETKRLSRILLTHCGVLDMVVLKSRKKELGKLIEYTMGENPLKQKSTTYYNLLGPYIFKAEFDSVVASKLDRFVATHSRLPLQIEAQKEIEQIVQTKGIFKLTIEKSEEKAKKMEQKLKKYFQFL